jgi:hypothetical protein
MPSLDYRNRMSDLPYFQGLIDAAKAELEQLGELDVEF